VSPEEETALQNQVVALKQIVEDMRSELDLYRLNGLGDAFSGRGNQVFGAGKMRLDSNGMQVSSDSEELAPIYFVSKFSNDPEAEAVRSEITGKIYNSASSSVWVTAHSQDSFAQFNVYALDNSTSDISLVTSQNDPTNTAMFKVSTNSSKFHQFEFTGGPILLPLKAGDYTASEGSIWYSTSTDTIRLEDANGTQDLVTRDWATNILSGIQFGGDGSTLTIANGEVIISSTYHKVDTESAAATDNLDYVYGPSFNGQLLMLRAANSARTVVLKDGTGNLKLAGDMTLDNAEDTITLLYDLTDDIWYEISRSNNGA